MSNIQPLQYDYNVDFLITGRKSYASKVQARQTTHHCVINSAKDTVAQKMDLSQEQKNAVRQVFHAQIGDLDEYEAAKVNGPARWAAIGVTRRDIRRDFEKLQKELGGQLDFTWDQLLAEVTNIRSASLAGSFTVTAGPTGTGSGSQPLHSSFSGRS